jgi:hypothetical protein
VLRVDDQRSPDAMDLKLGIRVARLPDEQCGHDAVIVPQSPHQGWGSAEIGDVAKIVRRAKPATSALVRIPDSSGTSREVRKVPSHLYLWPSASRTTPRTISVTSFGVL